jgi:hypothetical protein
MSTFKRIPHALILGSGLLDLLLVLLLSPPLWHQAQLATCSSPDGCSHPCIARNCPSDSTDRGTIHIAPSSTAS